MIVTVSVQPQNTPLLDALFYALYQAIYTLEGIIDPFAGGFYHTYLVRASAHPAPS